MLREGHGMLQGPGGTLQGSLAFTRFLGFFLSLKERPGFLSNYPLSWHFLGLYLCPSPSNPFPGSSRVLCPYPVQSFPPDFPRLVPFPFSVTILASTARALSERNPPFAVFSFPCPSGRTIAFWGDCKVSFLLT